MAVMKCFLNCVCGSDEFACIYGRSEMFAVIYASNEMFPAAFGSDEVFAGICGSDEMLAGVHLYVAVMRCLLGNICICSDEMFVWVFSSDVCGGIWQ